MHTISSRWRPEKGRPSKRKRRLAASLARGREARAKKKILEEPKQENKESVVIAASTSSENFSNDRFGRSIIKEELIISDESDNEWKYDIENCNSYNDEEYLMSNLQDAAGPQIEADVFSEIRIKTEEQPKQESPNTITDYIRSTKEIEEDVVDAIKEHCKTHCPKCKKKNPVIYRKAKCLTCRTALTYSCETCDKSYKNYTDLQYHIKLKHLCLPPVFPDSSDRSCGNCGRTFMRVKSRNEHQRGCGIEPRFHCTHCPYKARYKANLVTHSLRHEKKPEIKCPKCGKNYTNERSLRRHQSVYCDKKKLLQCAHCSRKVYRKDELINHLSIKHSFPKRAIPCKKKCGLNFKTYYKMRDHLEKCAKR